MQKGAPKLYVPGHAKSCGAACVARVGASVPKWREVSGRQGVHRQGKAGWKDIWGLRYPRRED